MKVSILGWNRSWRPRHEVELEVLRSAILGYRYVRNTHVDSTV